MSDSILNRTAALVAHVKALKSRKSQLEFKIDAEQARPLPDTLRLRRLKTRKLALRDLLRRQELRLAKLKPIAGHIAARQGGLA
ncbi:YdcH family protein [Shimia sediminis]|uniref:YdcH family protein n=1 Tax=Shimia sediminis TaxID=2497945 RepID=UPI0013DEABA9|nr:YdcH family protein [Shimia sediminis]